MKDIVISSKRIRIELITLAICFVVANLLNLYAIIAYQTSFVELLTQLGYVFIFSVVLYIAWSFLRAIFYLIKKLVKSKNNE
jgi:hypothetical protein